MSLSSLSQANIQLSMEREKGQEIVSSLRIIDEELWAVSIAQLHHRDLDWTNTVSPLVNQR